MLDMLLLESGMDTDGMVNEMDDEDIHGVTDVAGDDAEIGAGIGDIVKSP